MRDGFDRPIRYLRISVTDRCDLRCLYCAPAEGRALLPEASLLSLEAIARVAAAAVHLGVDKIRLTGGEPLLRPGLEGLVRELAALPGLRELGMTTNGTHLAAAAASLRAAGLGSVNVSLDTMDPARFERITRGGRLEAVMAGVEAALAVGLPVKLNIVVGAPSPPIGDEAPIGDEGGAGGDAAEGGADSGRAEAEAAAVEAYARRVGAATQRIRRYDLRAPKLDDPRFDRPPPCGACDRIRLLADGRLLPCLRSERPVTLDLDRIEESLLECVRMKPARGGDRSTLTPGQIGG